MIDFPSLAEVLTRHRPYGLDCKCGRPINSDDDWTDHIADAWREACTIRTVEQLDALPPDSVVITEPSRISYQKARTSLGVWYSSALSTNDSTDIDLPALLIWNPDWARP